MPFQAGDILPAGWVQCESVRAISVQRVVRQLGRARSQTVAEVRSQVINFLRDW